MTLSMVTLEAELVQTRKTETVNNVNGHGVVCLRIATLYLKKDYLTLDQQQLSLDAILQVGLLRLPVHVKLQGVAHSGKLGKLQNPINMIKTS